MAFIIFEKQDRRDAGLMEQTDQRLLNSEWLSQVVTSLKAILSVMK
jgi:hypothetical protein